MIFQMRPTIALNGHKLSIEELWKIASLKVSCELADEARPLIRRSRELVEKLAAQPRAIYGINTGFGPLSGFRVSDEDQKQHQINLLHHLTVGQGALFSENETRAIMLARANTLARGFSGIREELLELLLAALNKNVLPEIPSEGSVGASGDLVPLAHMAGLLVGFGHAKLNGEKISASRSLEKNRPRARRIAMQGRPRARQWHFCDDRARRAAVTRSGKNSALDGTAHGLSVSSSWRRTGSSLPANPQGARFSRPVACRPPHQ